LDANGNTYGYRFVNGSAGTAATTLAVLTNGTHALQQIMFGTAWTTSGIYRQGGGLITCDGPGGLTLATGAVESMFFAINNVEKMKLDSTGNLGIGTNPACALNVYGTNTAARGQLSIDASSSDARMTFYTAGTFRMGVGVSSTAMTFDPQNNQNYVFSGTGHVSLLGGQIKFPATQNASADANTLDDYEEGTFTPVFSFAGGTTGMETSCSGTYVKIGKVVTVYIFFILTTKGSSTGQARFASLPFTSAASQYGVGCLLNNLYAVTLTGQLAVNQWNTPGTTTIECWAINNGAQSALTDTGFSNSTQFYPLFTYVTT
jgi:hypothetical protein